MNSTTRTLLALIESLGLGEKVIFEHECNNVQLILPNFDVAIHPAYSESGPLVLIEYLGQGIPFLAHDVGEVTKTVKNKFPEYVIDTLELNAWKERLSKVLDSTSEEKKKTTTSVLRRKLFRTNLLSKMQVDIRKSSSFLMVTDTAMVRKNGQNYAFGPVVMELDVFS